MGRALGAIAFMALAYMVLMLAASRLGPSYIAGAAFLVPLIGVIGIAWAFRGSRERS